MTYRKVDYCALRSGAAGFSRLLGLAFLSALMAGAAWGQTRELVLSTERVIVSEGGGTSFTVALGSAPTGNVTVTLTQPSNTDVTVDTDSGTGGSQTTLTFTTSNWSSAQSVAVAAAQDADNWDDLARIRLSPKGGGYSRNENGRDLTLAYTELPVTVADDDRNAVMLSTTSLSAGESVTSLSINEGSSKNFMVRLTSQPSANVTVTFSESSAFLTLDTTSMTFTNGNWDQLQTLTVSVPEDNVDRVSSTETISVTATGNYAGANISVRAVDNDTRGVTTSVNSISLSEGGSAGTFTVGLRTEPTASVDVSLHLCAKTGGTGPQQGCQNSNWVTISPSTLTFTPSNYGTGQEVTVTPVEDANAGNESAFINMSGVGGGYVGFIGGGIQLTVADNDTRGLVVSPDNNFTVAQGTSNRLGIRLATQPSGDVNVQITKSGTHSADLTLNRASVGFTTSNWDQLQYVMASIDSDVDASQFNASIDLTASGSDYHPYCANRRSTCDAASAITVAESITVTLAENALRVSASSLAIDEGENETFTVRLGAKPYENVILTLAQPSNISVKVDTDTNVTGNQNTLTFTPDNWNTDQTVTVSAIQDDDADDVTSEAISITVSGAGYSRVTGSVSVSVDDDETYSFDVSETSLSLTEGGDSDTFTVALTAKPNQPVSLRLVVSDTGAITATPTTLNFNLSNYDTPQTVTVSPGGDLDIADESVSISIAALSFPAAEPPGSYDDITASVSVDVTDDDSVGLIVRPNRFLLDEGGGSKTIEVELATLPTADVTVSLTSGDTGAVTVSPVSLTFVEQDYYSRVRSPFNQHRGTENEKYLTIITPVVHTVTVTPVDDSDSANETVQISLSAQDGGYDGVTASTTALVRDDDLWNLSLSTTAVSLRKGGESRTFKVALETRPSGNVTVSLLSSDTSVATVSPASLTFTPSNYNRFKVVTVATTKGVNSANENASINLSATGGNYDSATGSVSVRVADYGIDLSSATLSLVDGGSAGTFTVALSAEPSADVTVSLTSSDPNAATVSPASLTFTSSNYDTTQTVTVTPVQDADFSDERLSISLISSGGSYDSVTDSVSVTVEDDHPDFVISPARLRVNEGSAGTFTLKLRVPPPAPDSNLPTIGGGSSARNQNTDVTVALVSSDTSRVTISPSSMTFTTSNYDTAQTVTVTTIEDSDTYSENVNINLSASGGRGSYDNVTGKVAVSVVDTSTGFDFSSTSLMVNEGETTTFTVTLNEQQPQSDVTVLVSSSHSSSLRVSPSQLTFSQSNYRMPQTVTLRAREDGDSDDENVDINFLASGGNYDDAKGRVAVSVTDDDIPALDISRTSLRVIEQATGTFKVKLKIVPSQNVTVSLVSSDTSSVTVSPSSMTFTPLNYDMEQTVIVAAIDDADLDHEDVNINLSASGGNYANVTGRVAVSVGDDDAALNISESRLRMVERNTDSFTVKLGQLPSGEVTVSLVSSDAGSVTVSPSSLTFLPSNYTLRQTVIVSAIEDYDVSDERVNINISASGGGYNNATGTVAVEVDDNDTPNANFTIHTPSTKIVSLTEGNWGRVWWELEGDPDPNTVISLRSSNENAVRVTPSSMVYGVDPDPEEPTEPDPNEEVSTINHRVFTVISVNDGDIMDEHVTIHMSASGGSHSGVTETVTVIVDDKDQFGLKLSPNNLSVTEGGSSGTFTVAINEPIFGDATVSLTSSDTNIATVSPASLTFIGSNYDKPQTVTITPVDDSNLLDESVEIILSSTVDTNDLNHGDPRSGFGRFNGRPVKFPVTVIDDDRFDLDLSRTSLSVNEGGIANIFTVALDSQPDADVTVSLTSGDTGAATVSPASLTFTSSNYDTPQTVSVSPVDDDDLVDENVNISFSVSGGGLGQSVLDAIFGDVSVSVMVRDDEVPALNFSSSNLRLTEGGAAGTFEVKLAHPPTARVMVSLESSDVGAATISPSTLNFTPSNYDTNRTVTVTPMDDSDLWNENVDITLSARGGGYDGVGDSMSVTVEDDETGDLEFSVTNLSLEEDSGDNGTFTVKLAYPPPSDVTVDLTSEDDGAVTVSPSQLTFTESNYDMPQTLTVTPVSDADPAAEYTGISLVASGGGYTGVTGRVSVEVADDDISRLRYSPSGRKHVTMPKTVMETVRETVGGIVRERVREVPGSGTFGVRLGSRPSGTVTLTVTQVLPDGKVLEFDANPNTTGNQNTITIRSYAWRVPKAIKMFAVDNDSVLDTSAVVRVTASGGGYDNQVLDVSVTIEGVSDRGNLVTDPVSSLTLDERSQGIFKLKLSDQPSGAVTVSVLSASAKLDLAGSTRNNNNDQLRYFRFNASNWDTEQNIVVNALPDVDSDNDTADLTLWASGGGANWRGKTLTVNITDVDTPNSIFVSSTELEIVEGEMDTFDVALTSSPGAGNTVTVAVAPDSGSDVSVDATSLTFNDSNWNVTQTVTVTVAEDDNIVSETPDITLTASGTSNYNGKTATVEVSVIDASRYLSTNPVSSLTISEGAQGIFSLKLSHEPAGNVTVSVLAESTKLDLVGSTRNANNDQLRYFRFNASNWDTAQNIALRALPDIDAVNDTAELTLWASGGGTSWKGKKLTVNMTDVDTPNSIYLSATALEIAEGTTDTFAVALTSPPGAGNSITVAVAPDSSSDLSVDKISLTFDNDDWNEIQTVTVTAGEDQDSVSDMNDITLTASGTSDYSGKTGVVGVTVIDEDPVTILLSDTSLSITEGGAAASLTVRLSSPPSEDVTVGVISRDISIARVSPASLMFDSSNWDTAQTVSVTAAEDDDFANESVRLNLTASGDDEFDGLSESIAVSVTDDDVYSFAFSDDTLSLNEGTSGSFTVALGARPVGDVTVTLVQPTNTDVTLDTDSTADGNQTTLSFTQSSWNVAQNVYVTASLDSDNDDETATISMSAAGGGYGLYEVTGSVLVSVVDSGVLNLNIGNYERSPSEGQTYSVDIRLASQPPGDVTVAVTSSDPSAVEITSPASKELMFTTSNWNTTQTLSFRAVEDADADNERVVISMSAAGSEYNFSRSLVVTTRDNDTVDFVLSEREKTVVEGVAGTFTVKLGSQPTGTVSVTISLNDVFNLPGDATIDTDTTRAGNQDTLTFTRSNWNTPRTIAVVPASDEDGQDETLYIDLKASGANYQNLTEFVRLDVTDDDSRGIILSDSSLLINEGGTASFSLRLAQRPTTGQRRTSTVKLHVGPGGGYFVTTSSSDTDGSDQNDVMLEFTDSNWDTAQTVTVSAPQDNNRTDERLTLWITALGGDHSDISPARVHLRVLDTNFQQNQTVIKEIDRGRSSEFLVLEAGDTANTFKVRLGSQPTQNVNVNISGYFSNLLTLDRTTLRFFPSNWSTAQTVTITPSATATQRPDTEYFELTLKSATTPAPTGGAVDLYRATRVFSVKVTRDGANPPATELTLTRPSLSVTAGSQTNTFRVALSAAPTKDVRVSMNMNREDFQTATTTPRSLVFTPSNWNTPQAVTVSAQPFTSDRTVVVVLNASSRIPVGQGVIDPYIMSQTVTVTLEQADVDLRPISLDLSKPSLLVTEGGTPGTFDVKLTSFNSRNSSDWTVQVAMTSGDTAAVTVSPATLDFTSTNWQTAQTVTVTAVEDADMDDERIAIDLDVSRTFLQTPPQKLYSYSYGVSVTDDDDSGFVVSPRTLTLAEGSGSTGSFTVALGTQPSADVTVAVASLAPSAATVSSGSLTFTPSNYNTAQMVTVTPVDDADLQDEAFNILLSASDGGYDGDSDSVAVTVEDDDEDSVDFTLSTKSLTIKEEGAGIFTVALSHEPTGTVTVTLSQPDNDDVTLDTNARSGGNQNTLTFEVGDWSEAKRVTVSAAHDIDSSNEGPLAVNLSASGGGYGSATDSLSISVTDNDPAELDVSVTALTVDEGGTATFTVALGTEPSGNVTVNLAQPSNTDIKVDANATITGNQTALSFGPGNWSTPQTVTVRVSADDDSDNEAGGISITASGGGYGSATHNVLVSVTDADSPGFILSASQVNLGEGDSRSFQLSLRTDPRGPVTVVLGQPTNTDVTLDTDAASGNQNTLDFDENTWDIPQTVTVSAITDRDAVNDTATINITALNSGYSEVTGSVTVNVADPQVPGLVWSESPLSILEGETKNLTLQLTTQPTEDVTVTLSQPSDTDVTLDTDAAQNGDQTTLSFTTSNWNTAQQVAFTVATDQDLDGSTATVGITASGGDYGDLSETLSITIIDKDAPRLVLSQSMLSLNEAGSAVRFTAALSILPTAPVSVSISAGSDAGLLVISETSLDFTASDWNTPQTIDVNAPDDSDAVDQNITISLSADGGNYTGVTGEIAVTIDDDEAELVLSAESLMVDEGGASRDFTVVLSSRPTDTVTLTLTSNESGAVQVDTDTATVGAQNTLTFTRDDWSTPRTIKVLAIEDGDQDEEMATITLTASGGDYNGAEKTVSVEVRENDIARIQLSEASLALVEGAAAKSFTVVFSVEPDQATTVSVTSSDPLAAEVTTGATLNFTPNDWSTPKQVEISAVQDDDAVDESITVTVEVTTTGTNFEDQSGTVSVSVDDDDDVGLALSESSLTVGEGGSSTFAVELASEPRGQVTVTLTQPANADVTLDTNDQADGNQNTLTFDASNWDDAQTVTVSAADDQDAENDVARISMTASGGDYANVGAGLNVTVTDDDTAGLVLSGNTLDIDEGSTGDFTVRLNTQPRGGDVTVSITSGDAAAATVSPVSLTFTADDWDDVQNVTVTGVEDDDAEDGSVTITVAASGADYANVADAEVTVTVTDDENTGMTLSATSLRLTEGLDGSFTVRLTSQPTANVTVSVTSSDQDVVTFSPASLTFTSTDWEDDQTVTLTAADDSDTTDEQGSITLEASGGGYDNESGTVAVEVWDDDRTLGLTLSRTGTLNLEEDPNSDNNALSLMVRLAAPPVGDVTVSVASDDDGAVSVSESSLSFTTLNWNIDQSLTVGAVQDADAQDEDVEVTMSPEGGGYGSGETSTLQVMVDDDEVAELRLSASQVRLDEGTTVNLTVTLTSQPTADVTVTFVNSDTTLLAVDADSFTNGAQDSMLFRTENWDTPQTVSIIAIEDDDLEDGAAKVTYRAAGGDYDGMNGEVDVEVLDNDRAAEERKGATQVLAAVARATLAGSLDVISRRFDASAGARRVQFGGRDVSLNQSGIDDLIGHFVQTARARDERFQSSRYGADLFGVNRQSGAWLGSIPLHEGRPASARTGADGFSSDLQMLGSFTYALTSSADSESSSMATSSLWGSSEQREFSGTVQQVPYEGNQSAVWLGYDQRTDNGWLYGVAASRSSGEADYKIRNYSARIETQLRTYMPYIEITGESGASVRIVYGFGIGEVKVQEINSNEGTAKLTMDMTSVGGRWPFLQIGIGGTLSATGSIASSRMTTGSSSSALSISELNVDSQQVRAGLELAHSGFGSGIRWAPRFGVSVRQDEGDGITGSGVEVTAAIQMTTPGSRFSLDLNGHWLASHSTEDETPDDTAAAQTVSEEDKVGLDEWGASLTLRVASSDAVGRGFSMSLGPEWGAQQSDFLDREEAFNLNQSDMQRMRQSAQRMVLATRLGYGLDAFGGLLTPFAEYHFNGGAHASSRLTSGVKFMGTDSFEARIFGEQRITQGRKPDNKIGVELRQYLF